MKKRSLEALKTLLIVLLLLSAVFLTLSANLFGNPLETPWIAALARPFAALFGYQVPEQPLLLDRPTLTDAAQPQRITVRNAAGRAGWFGDAAQLDAAFEALGGFLAEALDTAGAPAEITALQFRSALRAPSAYFEYPCPLPLTVLSAWLDADTQSTLSAARYVLYPEKNTVALLLASGDAYYRFDTQVDAATLLTALDAYPAQDVFFAFEVKDAVYQRLDPLTLLAPAGGKPPAVRAANPCDEAFASKAANLLGFNPYGDSSYRDDTGALVYTESDCTLRVAPDGTLLLRNLGLSGRYAAAGTRDAELIEYVRQTLAELVGGVAGDARLQLVDFQRGEKDVTVRFDYFVGGVAVEQPAGSAAEAVFSGGILSSLTVRVRAYTLDGGQTLPCLPPRQAAAIAPPGASLHLGYSDPLTGALEVGWMP